LKTVESSPVQRHLPNYSDLEYDDVEVFFTDDDRVFTENVTYTKINLENDEFTFLRQVEEKIKELHGTEQISDLELEILRMLSAGNSYKEVSEELQISRTSVRKNFDSSCNKIAFSLGGVFTNEGYKEYIAEKYSLTNEQAEKTMELLESNRRL
jgi:hypothetical protein